MLHTLSAQKMTQDDKDVQMGSKKNKKVFDHKGNKFLAFRVSRILENTLM